MRIARDLNKKSLNIYIYIFIMSISVLNVYKIASLLLLLNIIKNILFTFSRFQIKNAFIFEVKIQFPSIYEK